MSTRTEAPIAAINAALDDLAQVDPTYLTVGEKKTRLLALSRVIARAEADRLRVLAVAEDVAVETGARSTAHWLADATRDGIGQVRLRERLATRRGDATTAAMDQGAVNIAQAKEIVDALDALPADLDPEVRAKGEAHLVNEAAHFGPRELKGLGRKLLEVIAPEVADEAEYERLLAEDRRARAAMKAAFRDRGDGSSDFYARLPTPTAHRLKTYLESIASPRRSLTSDVDRLPVARQRGEAFCAFLENLPARGLPQHGGTTTSVVVTVDLDRLRDGLGLAETSTADILTAEQVRRLACQADLLPAVLGRKGQILDLGRTSRLFSPAQRKAMAVRDRQCTADGCTVPAAWCEAHHWKQPWSRGGKTDLADGKLLCSFHHHRAHDPGWETHHAANGSTTFHRRT